MEKSSFPVFAILAVSMLAATAAAANDCLSGLGSSAGSIPFNISSVTCATLWNDEDYKLAYEKNGSVWNFVLSAPDKKAYVGLGFSDTGLMAGASAVVGWIASNGSGIAWQYYLGGYNTQGVVPNDGNLTLVGGRPTIVSVSMRLYMAFRLQIPAGEKPKTKLIFSLGPDGFVPTSDFRLKAHEKASNITIEYVTGSGNRSYGSPSGSLPGSPSGSPTGSPSGSPSGSPTGSPFGSPTGSPSGSPSGGPTSPGPGGPPGKNLAGKPNHNGFMATFFGSVAVYLAIGLL